MKKKVVFLLLTAILTISCGYLPSLFATPTPTATLTATPTTTPSPTLTHTPTFTPTPSATPTPTIVPPAPPEDGYSNVYGRVIWRGEPVSDYQMHLDNSIAEVYSEFYYESVTTDSNGRFVFTRVPAGNDFSLKVYAYDSSSLAGIASAVDVIFPVPADSNLNLGDYFMIEPDLALLAPERDSQLTDMPASLNWKAYPGAAYYHVELKQLYGTFTDLELDTDETHVNLELPLMACKYGWDVTAYSTTGIPLARSDSAYEDKYDSFSQKYDGIFSIQNDLLPWCEIELISPALSAKITGGSVELQWEHHPLAAKYRVSITRRTSLSQGPPYFDPGFFYGEFKVLEDGSLQGPSLPFFRYGSYYWVVSAITEEGWNIAGSRQGYFWVP